MQSSDLDAVLALEQAAYLFPWSRGSFDDCLQANYSAWVVQISSQLVAYGLFFVAADEANILNVCVDPEYQQRGLGQRLLRFLLAQAKAGGAQNAFLEVRQSNQAAIALYDRVGFNQYAERKQYYPGIPDREDAVLYCKTL